MSTFSSSFARGTDQFQANLYSAAETIGELTGFDPLQAWGEEGVVRNLAEAAENPREIEQYDDIESLADFGTYVVQVLGEQLPQVLPEAVLAAGAVAAGPISAGAAAAGAAGFTAKQALTRRGAAAIGKAFAESMGKEAVEEFGKRKVKRTFRRALAGFALGAAPQNVGESRIQQRMEDVNDPFLALATGAVKTSLDTLSPAIAGKILATQTVAGKKLTDVISGAAVAAVKTGAAESVTEVAQTLTDQLALKYEKGEGYDLINESNFDELVDAALAGGIVGGGLGGAVGGLRAGDRYVAHRRQKANELADDFAQDDVGDGFALAPAAAPPRPGEDELPTALAENAPSPESAATLGAQLEALTDPSSTVDTVLIPDGSPDMRPPDGTRAFQTNRGVIVTSNAEKGAAIEQRGGELDEATLGALLLDRPASTRMDTDGRVVTARNTAGIPVKETATNEARIEEDILRAEGFAPAGGSVTVDPIDRSIEQREAARRGELEIPETTEFNTVDVEQAGQGARGRFVPETPAPAAPREERRRPGQRQLDLDASVVAALPFVAPEARAAIEQGLQSPEYAPDTQEGVDLRNQLLAVARQNDALVYADETVDEGPGDVEAPTEFGQQLAEQLGTSADEPASQAVLSEGYPLTEAEERGLTYIAPDGNPANQRDQQTWDSYATRDEALARARALEQANPSPDLVYDVVQGAQRPGVREAARVAPDDPRVRADAEPWLIVRRRVPEQMAAEATIESPNVLRPVPGEKWNGQATGPLTESELIEVAIARSAQIGAARRTVQDPRAQEALITVQDPDGQDVALSVQDLTSAGVDLLSARGQSTETDNDLQRYQGLLTMLGELQGRGYDTSGLFVQRDAPARREGSNRSQADVPVNELRDDVPVWQAGRWKSGEPVQRAGDVQRRLRAQRGTNAAPVSMGSADSRVRNAEARQRSREAADNEQGRQIAEQDDAGFEGDLVDGVVTEGTFVQRPDPEREDAQAQRDTALREAQEALRKAVAEEGARSPAAERARNRVRRLEAAADRAVQAGADQARRDQETSRSERELGAANRATLTMSGTPPRGTAPGARRASDVTPEVQQRVEEALAALETEGITQALRPQELARRLPDLGPEQIRRAVENMQADRDIENARLRDARKERRRRIRAGADPQSIPRVTADRAPRRRPQPSVTAGDRARGWGKGLLSTEVRFVAGILDELGFTSAMTVDVVELSALDDAQAAGVLSAEQAAALKSRFDARPTLRGTFLGQANEGGRGIIVIRDFSGSKPTNADKARRMFVLGHEMGHGVLNAIRDRLTPQQRARLQALYDKEAPANSFDEWFVDKVSARAAGMTTSSSPAKKSLAEKIFGDAVAELRKIWNALKGKMPARFKQNVSFNNFIDGLKTGDIFEASTSFAMGPADVIQEMDTTTIGQVVRPGVLRRLGANFRGAIDAGVEPFGRVFFTRHGQLERLSHKAADALYHPTRRILGARAWHQSTEAARERWIGEARRATRKHMAGLDDEAQQGVMRTAFMQLAQERPTQELSPLARDLRAVLERYKKEYLEPAIPTLGHIDNFWPRVWNTPRILSEETQLKEMFERHGIADPKALYDSLVAVADDSIRAMDAIVPRQASWQKRRKVLTQDNPELIREMVDSGYLNGNPVQALKHYVHHTAKRAEFESRFGDYVAKPPAFINDVMEEWGLKSAQQGIDWGYFKRLPNGGLGVWDPEYKLGRMLAEDEQLTGIPNGAKPNEVTEAQKRRAAARVWRARQLIRGIYQPEVAQLLPRSLRLLQIEHSPAYSPVERKAARAARKGDPWAMGDLLSTPPRDRTATEQELVEGWSTIRDQVDGPIDRTSLTYRVIGGIRSYEALRTLAFSGIASIPEAAAVLARGHGVLTTREYFSEVGKTLKDWNEARAFAEDMGFVTHDFASLIHQEMFGPGTEGRAGRAVNWMMKWNGNEFVMDFTKALSASTGKRFLARISQRLDADPNDSAAKRYLAELGMSREQLKLWADADMPMHFDLEPGDLRDAAIEAHRAISLFVHQSSLSPSAAERPAWADHPLGAVAFQLKQFMYSFAKGPIAGIGREAQARLLNTDVPASQTYMDTAAYLAATVGVFLFFGALSEEIRQRVASMGGRGALGKAYGDPVQFMENALDRSGLNAIPYTDFLFDPSWNNAVFAMGPTISHADALMRAFSSLDGSPKDNIRMARALLDSIPGASQTPAIRRAVYDYIEEQE